MGHSGDSVQEELEVATMPITVEFRCGYSLLGNVSLLIFGVFSGGLELLFSNQRTYKLQIPVKDPSGNPSNVGFLVGYLCDNLMKDKRKDMFVMDGTV